MDDFRRDLKNIWLVLLVLWILLSSIGLLLPLAWSFLFAIMLGFVIFDVIFDLFLKRRKVPISGSQKFQPRGYRFLAFIAGILLASLLSAFLAEGLAGYLTEQATNRLLTVPTSGILCILLYVDFRISDEPP